MLCKVSAAAVCLALGLATWCVFQESNRRGNVCQSQFWVCIWVFAVCVCVCVCVCGFTPCQYAVQNRIDFSVWNQYVVLWSICIIGVFPCPSFLTFNLYPTIKCNIVYVYSLITIDPRVEGSLLKCLWCFTNITRFHYYKTCSHVFIWSTCLLLSRSRETLTFCHWYYTIVSQNNTFIAKATVGTKQGYSNLWL
jgi:hypothetical protein